MKVQGFLRLFWTTLVFGTLFGFLMNLLANPGYLVSQSWEAIVTALSYSSTWTGISMMGFFAYLIIHRVGLDLFRGPRLWNRVQVLLIAFAIFDAVYLRMLAFGNDHMWRYIGEMLVLLIVAWVVAASKAKQTNKSAFIPTLFLMTVITLIEWIPALQTTDEIPLLWPALATLVFANAYQVLMLHRFQQTGQVVESTSSETVKKKTKKQMSSKSS
ncbi:MULTISPECIES: KinB-signaling pathway activation protein [Exiguobacterium]|jgi:KinB signaling pathway activation protein|uniref:Activation of the KinB signalling pathway of sporulation n=2 Tax=Exiguobacterium TaxID=33986 RepID=C4KZL0_EXISA|nr:MULTISPECIES: KinB-signaling pathway activation protein [Exiguobacterium]MCC9626568.1 KinB-signaling pathway activation protein [Thalassospira sp. MA62]ACQ70523.1 activation of the KinB signalling pathway of sporulation [Exiguobacterium sp. AT1b]MCM3280856.1 KinB-signaling pathway activation protein [Exiguobacterium sp. MER 193]MDX5981212.1 KinB-signaling pathway activation protein [Exiguobacterium profundum]WED55430.1 KinB-signaling pathway activation protein [Exiguobacterium profundum]